jgi:hypothetical protein
MTKICEVAASLSPRGNSSKICRSYQVCRRAALGGEQTKGDMTMSNAAKIVLSAALILSTAFSAMAASKAGATREQGASSGTGVASYDRNGGLVSGNWR